MTENQRELSSWIELGASQLHTNTLYAQARQKLLQMLNERIWKPGEKIPPEPVLAKTFGISVGTLRRAVNDLVADGILIRRQGSGTFVATYQTAYWNRFLPFQQRNGRPLKMLTRIPVVFEHNVINAEVARKLSLKSETPLIHIIRHMYGEENVFLGVDEIYLEKSRYPGFTKAFFMKRLAPDQSLYAFYEKQFNVMIVRANNVVRVTVPDKNEAQRLARNDYEGKILFQYERISTTYGHVPVEYRIIRVDPELMQIAFDL